MTPMSASTELRAQLQSLKISKTQRPTESRSASGRRAFWPLLLLFLALAAGGGYLAVKRNPQLTQMLPTAAAAPEVPLVPVVVSSTTPAAGPVLTATGKIVSDHRVLVFTKVSGQIQRLYFEQGDRVKAGQVLAEIEDVLFVARRNESAASLESSRANLAFQQVNFERIRRLYESRTAPEIEFKLAERDYKAALAQVARDEATLAFTDKLLVDTKVVAPIDGVVLERNVNVGDFVAAEGGRGAMSNAQLGSIADMTKLRVEVDISELDIARLRDGMPCEIAPDAYKDRRYRGHIMWIDPGANYSKATVQVKVRIENPDEYLRVEGVAQVSFRTEQPAETQQTEPEAAIWIPVSACRLDASGETGRVFVASAGRLKEAVVQIGRRAGDKLQVVSGLVSGQQIAAAGLDQLKDGQRFSPRP